MTRTLTALAVASGLIACSGPPRPANGWRAESGAAAGEIRSLSDEGAPRPRLDALRVCSDPNNLPFSNDRGEGFENAIAELIASDLGRPLQYTWFPQRRGFIRNTLQAGDCDVVLGVPAENEMTRTTKPYYTSTYVFVTRADRPVQVRSLDDAALRGMRIGLHVIGDDYANVPPAQALARRGIIANVRGYSIYGDYSKPNPPADLISAVAEDEVDVAIAWGPLAGYFATRQKAPLRVLPVHPSREGPVPFTYEIAMGVRRGDTMLLAYLDGFIEREQDVIEAVLRRFGVPLVDAESDRDRADGAEGAAE